MLGVIIPYFKLSFFEETLQSLENQTIQQFKVYIGDDASPESPLALLEKYKGKFNFVYHKFEENLGSISLTKQWERCIELSNNEEWLMILGDDDVMSPNAIETFYNNLTEIEEAKSNIVRYASQIIDENGNPVSEIYQHPKLENAADSFWRKYTWKTRSSLSEYIFRREVYSKFKFVNYPLAWHSDDLAWIKFSNFKNIYSINLAQIYVRESSLSISGKTDNFEQKKNASLQFYTTLSDKYLSIFRKEQRLVIIAILENEYFEKKEFSLLIKIVKWHLKHSDIYNLAKFFRRIYINR
ncbi:glycosyltransferase family 2 protein [Flavobacterium pectinovorum]|uniref:Glycosyltransferase family 2 protein n=1 Tax=Flavobacterium pectinovorum TaxID=29533 RepID=A0A502EQQ2_9FLAO|nr:glycosyltransferase family 2 protein [Flavobacterium pectinovorum]TPG40113.1 glycosyltransferase family 2 protein [Flavobacterium pectinovorum]